MKLFTKYRPVEGEIKEGDYFKANHNDNIGVVTLITGKEGSKEKLIHYGKNWVTVNTLGKKYKLFLCSRDIQEGDEMLVLNKNILWGEVGEYCKLLRKMGSKCEVLGSNGITYLAFCSIEYAINRGDVCKVIGEVSKDAIWVKEGMEFDESQVQYNTYDILTNAHEAQDWTEAEYDHISYFKFLCSQCKTFH